jgi:hypothetical protein
MLVSLEISRRSVFLVMVANLEPLDFFFRRVVLQ